MFCIPLYGDSLPAMTTNSSVIQKLLLVADLPVSTSALFSPSAPVEYMTRNIALCMNSISVHYHEITPVSDAKMLADLVVQLAEGGCYEFAEDVLLRDCLILLPTPLEEPVTIAMLCEPLIALLFNQQWLVSKLLFPALYMAVLHHLFQLNDRLTEKDLSLLIDIFSDCPPELMGETIMDFVDEY